MQEGEYLRDQAGVEVIITEVLMIISSKYTLTFAVRIYLASVSVQASD